MLGKPLSIVVVPNISVEIDGPTDQVLWVLTFKGLAEEDSFSNTVFKDEAYMKTMAGFEGIMTPPVDNLHRRET